MGENIIETGRTIDPYDGRYVEIGQELSPWFSEMGLQHLRTTVEVKYLQALSKANIIRPFENEETQFLEGIIQNFGTEDFAGIKAIEAKKIHDVAAVAEYLQNRLSQTSLADVSQFVHWCMTSEDVTNLAYRIGLKESKSQIIIPEATNLISTISRLAEKYKELPMLGMTHGQPAVTTTFGKEMVNFAIRFERIKREMINHQFRGKMTGAVGNLNAHVAAYPEIDWLDFSERFVNSLGLEPELITTQVNPNDDIVEYLGMIRKFNTLVHAFDRDIWLYVSRKVLVQEVGGVGSSTMPQKINPINFEHSEGVSEISEGLSVALERNLPESRWQRDLSDTMQLRFLGPLLAETIDVWKKTCAGVKKIKPDGDFMHQELWENFAILSEPLQLILRRAGINAYEMIRKKVQGKKFTETEWTEMVERTLYELGISDGDLREELCELTPDKYIGFAVRLTEIGLAYIRDDN